MLITRAWPCLLPCPRRPIFIECLPNLLLVAGDLDAVLGAEPDGGGASRDGVVMLYREREREKEKIN